MRKILIIAVVLTIISSLCLIIFSSSVDSISTSQDVDIIEDVQEMTWEEKWNKLLIAIIEVESRGNQYAEGDCMDRGILQITPILIEEVNRLSDIKYSHDDAWDIEKSKEMFYIIARHYCPEHNYEKMARIWNGGPRGPYKSCTQEYWNRVQKELTQEG